MITSVQSARFAICAVLAVTCVTSEADPQSPQGAHSIPSVTLSDSVRRLDLALQSDGVRLSGSIVEPSDQQSSVGVVLLPGSGPATRNMLLPAAVAFAERGVTALIFDKRGSGDSAGDWTSASLDDLAGDAAAAMIVLADRLGVELSDIGIWGHSQGVWVAMRTSEKYVRPRFIVAVSGGGVSPRITERFVYETRLREAGADPDEVKYAITLVDCYFSYLAGNITKAEFDFELSTSTWTETLDFPMPGEDSRGAWSWVATYDPNIAGDKNTAATLVVIGGQDAVIPVPETIETWTSYLNATPSSEDRIMILPDADHHLRQDNNDHHGFGVSTEPLLWDEIVAWVQRLKLLPK